MATVTKTRASKGSAPVQSVKRAAKDTKRTAKVAKAVSHGPAPERDLVRKVAGKALKRVAAQALESGAAALAAVVQHATDNQPGAPALKVRQVPIQRSIDVAVPIRVAWAEWMRFEVIPEGVDRVVEVERDGDELVGRISGHRSAQWVAEITDEREQESFAWLSHEGSDCAGLITFHELSERLTRIELDLDIEPTSIGQGVTFSTHVADRRAEADLRRFKARLEFINPDIYESEDSPRPSSGGSKRRARRNHKPESKGDAA